LFRKKKDLASSRKALGKEALRENIAIAIASDTLLALGAGARKSMQFPHSSTTMLHNPTSSSQVLVSDTFNSNT